jgi:hypothetical protein
MGENYEDLIGDLAVLLPAVELEVSLQTVFQEEGVFMATADHQGQRIQVGWICRCNDHPEVGQVWLVRVLGYDKPSKIWLAYALIRES